MSPIESSVYTKLVETVGHRRVYPDQIPMKEDGDEPDCVLPALAFRLVSGNTVDSIGGGNTTFKDDTFLIEVFDRDADANQKIRSLLFKEFTGPPDKTKIGWPKRWIEGGPKIRWAVTTDPSTDTEFTTNDAHDTLRFVQFLLTITYHEGVLP